jgi:hypothetical protein
MAEIAAPESGDRLPPSVKFDVLTEDAKSPELELGLREAFGALGIKEPDEDATGMALYAARLVPEEGSEAAISTTRLLAGAAAIGQSSLRTKSYLVALWQAIKNNPSLQDSYQNVRTLFKPQAGKQAAERLQGRWFSANVEKALITAFKERGDQPLSDSIVRAMLRDPSEFLRRRIDVAQLASSTEELFRSQPIPTVLGEINAALEARNIPAIESTRSVLFRAAAFEGGRGVLLSQDIVFALLELGQRSQGFRTAPSAMFAAANTARHIPSPPVQAIDQPAQPSRPLRLDEDAALLLHRAFEKQKNIFRNGALGTKGLIVAILTTRIRVRGELGFTEFDTEQMSERFRDVLRERLADNHEELQEWNRALGFEAAALPKLSNDQPGLGAPRDKLGITNDALAIANVAAGQNTNLPLAFGIFGDWGAGKSFFMRLIQDQIAGFVKSTAKNDGFEHAIVQIQFNAWHYAETNLWASLVGHIFDELDRWMTRTNGADDAKTADQILNRLTTSRQLMLDAAIELVQRRKEHAKAGRALEQAQGELTKAQDVAAREPATVWRAAVAEVQEEVFADEDLKQQFGALQAGINVPEALEGKAKFTAALDELSRSASAGSAALGALRSTVGNRGTIALAVVVLAGVPLVIFIAEKAMAAATGWSSLAEIGRGFEILGGLLGMLTVLTKAFSNKVREFADKFAGLKRRIDSEIAKATQKEREAMETAAATLARSAADVENARALAKAAADQVVAALKEFAEETGATRIRRFVRARAGAEGYGKHLGLISTIRKDFEQLESLMFQKDEAAPAHLEEARKHYRARVKALIRQAEGALEKDECKQLLDSARSVRSVKMPDEMRFRRIVLYIDDLDRCEPDKVVEVLQAVNMLLSFRLFVVMVAVDARWLSRSLETRYPDFFAAGTEDHDKQRKDSGEGAERKRRQKDATKKRNGSERATAADYLEKIFQIPYWVPTMTGKTSIALVGELVAADRIVQSLPGSDPQPVLPPIEVNAYVGPKAEDDQDRIGAAPSRALGLTDAEIKTLTALSPYLGGSPRRARRFVNVYRVAKASLTPDDVKKLEERDHMALATQLAIATGAPNAFGAWVKTCESPTNSLIEDRLRKLRVDRDERNNIHGALGAFRTMVGLDRDVLSELSAQSDRASRFSFVVPRKTMKPIAAPGAK